MTDVERKRHFLEVLRRWERLFKRADRGSIEDDKWLIAEYYKSLSHLSAAGLEALTDRLKQRCTFFPTVHECLEEIKPSGPYEWGHPFLNKPQMFVQRAKELGDARTQVANTLLVQSR